MSYMAMINSPLPYEEDTQYRSIYQSEVAWVGNVEIHSEEEHRKHRHGFWEFLGILEGEGTVHLGDESFSAGKGDLFVYPPGTDHYEYPNEASGVLSTRVLCILNISDVDFMRFWPVDRTEFCHITGSWLNEKYLPLSQRILDEVSLVDSGFMIRVRSLCFEWMSYLIMYAEQQGVAKRSDPPNQYVQRSIKYIEANYDQNIRLTDIAANAYVSTHYLAHIFKEQTGYSPINYLVSLRINKAKKYLTDSEYSISQISQMVGYEDLQHFSNAFKKHTGYSPRMYRQQFSTSRNGMEE